MSLMVSVLAVVSLLLSLYCNMPAKVVSCSRKLVNLIEEHRFELVNKTAERIDFKSQAPDERLHDLHLESYKRESSQLLQSLESSDRLSPSMGPVSVHAPHRSSLVRYVHHTFFL